MRSLHCSVRAGWERYTRHAIRVSICDTQKLHPAVCALSFGFLNAREPAIALLGFSYHSRPSRCEEDLHLQAVDHSRDTKTARKLCRISGPSYFQGFELRRESLCRLQKSKPRSFFRSRSNQVHFSECLSKLGQRILIICSPMSSPTSRGVCTLKRRRFNGLGEMMACLQSRCSPS